MLHPPAKVNLCLELLGKRPDGFHELRTAMATLRWCDTLRVTRSDSDTGVRLTVSGGRPADGVPTQGENLVVRALEALRHAAGAPYGVHAHLHKRLPSQAGLGGGSSDAAAALVGGARVWGIDWPTQRLAEVAATLGSDVPFFVHSLTSRRAFFAVASGRGEQVRAAPATAGAPIVVAKPTGGLSTAEVYAAVTPEDWQASEPSGRTDKSAESRCDAAARAVAAGDPRALAAAMTNHLQRAAARVAPWIDRVRHAFESTGFIAHQLSGSGSAYFGLSRSHSEARRFAARLRALRIGQVIATTIG